MTRIYSKSHIPAELQKPAEYGLEKTPAEYVANMRALFAEVRRVLKVTWIRDDDPNPDQTHRTANPPKEHSSHVNPVHTRHRRRHYRI